MGKAKFDFSGYATKVDLKCSDGRVIRKDAFKHNDGQVVPLVWQHFHNDPDNILGHALLENRDDGVYAYGAFNDTPAGTRAKVLVEHGDIKSLSIYANQLKQKVNDVIHGDIKEVSLVLAGANPGAFIDNLSISHADGSSDVCDDEALIFTGEALSLTDLEHTDKAPADDNETMSDVFNTLNEKQKQVVYAMISNAIQHADQGTNNDNGGDQTMSEIFDTLTEKQKEVVYVMLDNAMNMDPAMMDSLKQSDDQNGIKHSDKGGFTNMKKNIFDKDTQKDDVLSHSDMEAIFADAKRYGSLKDAVIQHGITNIDYLFPDATSVDGTPQFIQRDTGWVQRVMAGVHNTPFARIKSTFADITAADARAKGYIKGNLKAEEVFSLLKRTTTPTTIYKKQKLDRDDVVDIIDFDVVAWLKGEMRMMLDEEIARAVLVGDGRLASSDDKINEGNIRPIWKDEDLYTIKASFDVPAAMTADERAKAFIRSVIKSRKSYKGSGQPSLFTTEDMLTDCLLLEDSTGRIIYDSVDKLATAMRVKEIITVPVMEDLTRDNGGVTMTLHGIVVNLNDYNVGADKGGAVNMFDDFDIDYNAQKYLIETRASGALTKPFSAIAIESKPAA